MEKKIQRQQRRSLVSGQMTDIPSESEGERKICDSAHDQWNPHIRQRFSGTMFHRGQRRSPHSAHRPPESKRHRSHGCSPAKVRSYTELLQRACRTRRHFTTWKENRIPHTGAGGRAASFPPSI